MCNNMPLSAEAHAYSTLVITSTYSSTLLVVAFTLLLPNETVSDSGKNSSLSVVSLPVVVSLGMTFFLFQRCCRQPPKRKIS